jgi:hypothetical protein
VKFKNVQHQLIFHAVVFAFLLYLLTEYIFVPNVNVVEGIDEPSCSVNPTVLNKYWLMMGTAASNGCSPKRQPGIDVCNDNLDTDTVLVNKWKQKCPEINDKDTCKSYSTVNRKGLSNSPCVWSI